MGMRQRLQELKHEMSHICVPNTWQCTLP